MTGHGLSLLARRGCHRYRHRRRDRLHARLLRRRLEWRCQSGGAHDATEHSLDMHGSAALGHPVLPRAPGRPDAEHRSARSRGDGVRPRLLPEPDLHAEPGVVPEREVSDRDRGAAQRQRRLPGRYRAGAADVPGCRLPDRADRQAPPVAGAGRGREAAGGRRLRRILLEPPPGPGLGAGGARLRGLARGEGRRRGGDLRSAAGRSGAGVDAEHHQTTWAGDRAQRFIRTHAGRPWFLSINLFDPHPPFDPPADYLARFDRAEMPGPVFAASDLAHQARLFEVDQQSRVAVDPRSGRPGFAALRAAGGAAGGSDARYAARDL